MSLIVVLMVVTVNDTNVLVEAEDGACQEERLGDVVEQAAGYIVDVNHLVGHECNAAHDEQHRTGVLRDFKACVFHSSFEHEFHELHEFPTSWLLRRQRRGLLR